MMKLLPILFVYCQMGYSESEGYVPKMAQKLSKFQSLFPEDYDQRTAPPQTNEGEPNDIKVALDIVNIPRLDEKDEILS